MANFDGYTPHPIERFTSLFEQDDPTNAPLGVAAVSRNARYHLTGVRSRDGLNVSLGNCSVGMDSELGSPITGLYSFKFEGNGVLPDKQVPMIFDQNGNLLVESPAGSGVMRSVTSTQVTPPQNAYLQATQTLNRAHLCFTNIAAPSAAGSTLGVYDLNTGILDPLSMRPVGQTWQAGTTYAVGEVVTATPTKNLISITFRCTTAGTSGANEPVWNALDGATTNDGTAQWTQTTLRFTTAVPRPDTFTFHDSATDAALSNSIPQSGFSLNTFRVAAVGGYAANRDVYIAVTLVNGNGETDPLFQNASTLLGTGVITNTAANDQLKVKVSSAGVATWLSGLPAGAPTGWNLYVADVATGAAAPAPAAYQKVAGGPFALAFNTQVLVNSTPATTSPPTVNTANIIAAAGNVDAGQRWAVVLFVNRNGYICGFSGPSAVTNNFDPIGQVFCMNIAIGPPQTVQRIVAFSQAGGTSAGPFAYIPFNDSFNGLTMTTTVINDNVTTTATFNFVDLYLEDLMATTSNVTNFDDKIQVPPCRSVTYLESLDRMAYLAYELPSGAFISDKGDPETVFGSTGDIEVAETDGQNLMGLIDYKGIIYALKEKSGHEVNPSADDPSAWTYIKRWDGMGPCGLRAFDSGTHFFVFVHRSGVYASWGDVPQRLIKEIPITWSRVNFQAAATIWVKIDEDTHEFKIGVPLDGSLVPSHILTCNYEEDITLNPPIHSTIYSKGKFISSAAARKWSVDDIAANSCTRALRNLQNVPAQLDSAMQVSQLLFASTLDGTVMAQTPRIYIDSGADGVARLIPFVYETVCPGDALKVSQLGGIQALLNGQGSIGITVLASSTRSTQEGGVNQYDDEIVMPDATCRPGMMTAYSEMASGMNERYRVRTSTIGKNPGTWVDIKSITIFTKPIFQARPG